MNGMTKERQREISAAGGRAAHAQGKAHEFKAGSELARTAGRKGGEVHRAKMEVRKRERVTEICKASAEAFRKTPLAVTNATMGGCLECGHVGGTHVPNCSMEALENTTLAELPSAELE